MTTAVMLRTGTGGWTGVAGSVGSIDIAMQRRLQTPVHQTTSGDVCALPNS
jgi:hypothetical protein